MTSSAKSTVWWHASNYNIFWIRWGNQKETLNYTIRAEIKRTFVYTSGTRRCASTAKSDIPCLSALRCTTYLWGARRSSSPSIMPPTSSIDQSSSTEDKNHSWLITLLANYGRNCLNMCRMYLRQRCRRASCCACEGQIRTRKNRRPGIPDN